MPAPDKGGSWGILGGSFDPVHFGHLSLAEEIIRIKRLEGVLLVPSYRHASKDDCRASFEDRAAMAELAVRQRSRLIVSRIEKEQDLSGYTLDTVRALKERFPKARLFFVMGEDNLRDLEKWHAPEEIIREVLILVGFRPPHSSRSRTAIITDRIEMVPTRMVDASSTMVRDLLATTGDHEALAKLAPQAVLEYICEKGLYR
jgi:nicotinate-nucleotide adenylyltransferase